MKLFRISLLFLLAVPIFPQLTEEQRVTDFLHLAGLYAKQYAPYEWKRDTQGFDLLNAGSVRRARASKNDLDFYEVMVEYSVAQRRARTARFHLTLSPGLTGVDIYDGGSGEASVVLGSL
jgi:hypothetical protein